jgi:hypothetical protein
MTRGRRDLNPHDPLTPRTWVQALLQVQDDAPCRERRPCSCSACPSEHVVWSQPGPIHAHAQRARASMSCGPNLVPGHSSRSTWRARPPDRVVAAGDAVRDAEVGDPQRPFGGRGTRPFKTGPSAVGTVVGMASIVGALTQPLNRL